MKFRGALLATTLATVLSVATALPSYGLEIYEPDGRSSRPQCLRTQVAVMFQSAETQVRLVPGGAARQEQPAVRQCRRDPQQGRPGARRRVRQAQRVISLVGDDGTRANEIAAAINAAHANGSLRADKIMPGRRDKQLRHHGRPRAVDCRR